MVVSRADLKKFWFLIGLDGVWYHCGMEKENAKAECRRVQYDEVTDLLYDAYDAVMNAREYVIQMRPDRLRFASPRPPKRPGTVRKELELAERLCRAAREHEFLAVSKKSR